MKNPVRFRAPGYDLFKLIVTVLLLVFLVFIGLRSCNASRAPVAGAATPGINPLAAASPSSVPTTVVPTMTVVVATPTSAPTVTAAVPPSPTATIPAPEATATEAPQTVSATSCNTILPSRLVVGNNARVIRNLNMREAPSIIAAILQTNRIGTQVQITDGPVCTPQGDSAYLWWRIRLEGGAEGWSAETPLSNSVYFLEPVP